MSNKKDNISIASAKDISVKSSVDKINLVKKIIVGQKVSVASLQLKFCERRVSDVLLKILNSAVANAENNHGLDIDNLIVKEINVGKSFTLKRFRARARGRGNRILKPRSKVEIIVEEAIM